MGTMRTQLRMLRLLCRRWPQGGQSLVAGLECPKGRPGSRRYPGATHRISRAGDNPCRPWLPTGVTILPQGVWTRRTRVERVLRDMGNMMRQGCHLGTRLGGRVVCGTCREVRLYLLSHRSRPHSQRHINRSRLYPGARLFQQQLLATRGNPQTVRWHQHQRRRH